MKDCTYNRTRIGKSIQFAGCATKKLQPARFSVFVATVMAFKIAVHFELNSSHNLYDLEKCCLIKQQR